MQKVIFLTIDVQELVANSHTTHSISICDEINEFLETGWEIEEWSFLLDNPVDDKVPIMVLLNDDRGVELDEWDAWQDEAEDQEAVDDPAEK